jgi:hypothetical protein
VRLVSSCLSQPHALDNPLCPDPGCRARGLATIDVNTGVIDPFEDDAPADSAASPTP